MVLTSSSPSLPPLPIVRLLHLSSNSVKRTHPGNQCHRSIFLWLNSIRAICTRPTVLSFCQIPHQPATTEARLFGVQYSHAGPRLMEVSVHGLTPNRNGRLVSVREPWSISGDFFILKCVRVEIYIYIISVLHSETCDPPCPFRRGTFPPSFLTAISSVSPSPPPRGGSTPLGPGLRRALHECPPSESTHVHIHKHDIAHRAHRQPRVVPRHRPILVRHCSGHRRAARVDQTHGRRRQRREYERRGERRPRARAQRRRWRWRRWGWCRRRPARATGRRFPVSRRRRGEWGRGRGAAAAARGERRFA